MEQKLGDLLRKARRLAAERDRLIDSLVSDWATALRGQPLSATDWEELWAGLTEETVRRGGAGARAGSEREAWRLETQEVIARVREKVEAALHDR